MKYPLPIVLLTASVFVTGCSSLENPFSGWFGTGRDARVYNAQTGQYEWPADSANPRAGNAAAGAAPAPERRGDGRYYDAARNEWVQAPVDAAASRPRSKTAIATPAPLPPPPTAPPPPPPERASGIYNSSTGQIEWNSSDAAPRSTPAPEPSKKWWWPF